MKPYFIKDDDGNYLNPSYIYETAYFKYSRPLGYLVFWALKKAKNYQDLDSTKCFQAINNCDEDMLQWIDNITLKIRFLEKIDEGYGFKNQNLMALELSDLTSIVIHTALDSDKISHINSIYENNIFQYFEIVYIDSDQGTIKKFDSEELAQDWIAEHFKVI